MMSSTNHLNRKINDYSYGDNYIFKKLKEQLLYLNKSDILKNILKFITPHRKRKKSVKTN